MKKIGVVLNNYPVKSEPFIETFLQHLEHYEIYIFANFTNKFNRKKNWKIRQYLNPSFRFEYTLECFYILFKGLIFFNRAKKIYKCGISWKQIISDAPIWTTSSLDILHFPFANIAFSRKHYAEILGAKMTLSFRGSDINIFPIYHKMSYESLWSFVDKIHCNSIELALKLRDHNILNNLQVDIISPALRLDLNNFKPSSLSIKKNHSIDNLFIIISLGRLHWVKDFPLALRTIVELKKMGKIVQFHILGEGIEREHIMFLINELGLVNEVFLHGLVDAFQIKHLLSQAHIYLQTSLAEGFSNACMEAQAFGLPCVVPAISGMNDCLEDGKTGIIVHERTEKAFAEAILEIMINMEKFDAEYISSRIKTKFCLEKQRKQWLNFFEELLP